MWFLQEEQAFRCSGETTAKPKWPLPARRRTLRITTIHLRSVEAFGFFGYTRIVDELGASATRLNHERRLDPRIIKGIRALHEFAWCSLRNTVSTSAEYLVSVQQCLNPHPGWTSICRDPLEMLILGDDRFVTRILPLNTPSSSCSSTTQVSSQETFFFFFFFLIICNYLSRAYSRQIRTDNSTFFDESYPRIYT